MVRCGGFCLTLAVLPVELLACESFENETLAASLRILDGSCDRIRTGLDCKDDDLSDGTKNGVKNADDCCALCAADSRCKAWTVYPERKVCYLKSGCSNPIQNKGTSGGSAMPPAPGPAPSGPCTADTWQILPDMPIAIGEVFATAVNGRIVLAGEEHDKEKFPTLEYDVAGRMWTKHSKRPYAGNHHTAELVDDQIMLFGGFDNGAPGKIQVYDTSSRQWSELDDMPYATGSACSWLVGRKVYVCGGILGNGHKGTTDQCYVYDIDQRSWTQFESMPQGRNHAACATDGSRLFVFGGRMGNNVPSNGDDTVMVYDTETLKWDSSDFPKSKLAPLPQRRGGTGRAVLANGEFYVFGGETGDDPSATSNWVYDRVDIYKPSTNSWRSGAPMPKARHGMFPVLVEDKIYIAGGGVHHGNSQVTAFTAYCVGGAGEAMVV